MKHSTQYTLWRSLLCFGLLLLSAISYFAERAGPGGWATWNHILGLVLVAWYMWIFLRGHNAVVLTSFHSIFYSLGMLFSAAIISSGAHMIEIDQYGTQNGFFWIMMIFFVTGMEATRVGYNFGGRIHLGPPARPLSPTIDRLIIFLITGTTLAIATYVFIVSGGPVLLGVDRVTFWLTMAPSGTSFLPSLVNQSFFFAALYFLWRYRSGEGMILPAAILLGYILTTLFILGQKFSAFILFLNTWLVILPGILPGFRFRLRHVIMVSLAVTAILLYVAFSYLLDNKDISFIITRAALQAQLLWSVFEDPGALTLWPNEAGCYFGCGTFSSGMEYITYKFLPEGLFNHYAQAGNVLSGFMPALSILTFGLFASFLIHLTISFILGFVQNKIVASLGRRNLIYAFFLFKVQLSLVIMWFAAQEAPLRGMMLTLALIIIYRIAFATEFGRAAPRWMRSPAVKT